MDKFLQSALGKAVLDGLRVMVLSIIPILADFLASGEFNLNMILVAAALSILKSLDKFLHEFGKENEDDLLIKGLVRF
jgi:hypothetical protein